MVNNYNKLVSVVDVSSLLFMLLNSFFCGENAGLETNGHIIAGMENAVCVNCFCLSGPEFSAASNWSVSLVTLCAQPSRSCFVASGNVFFFS